MGLWHPERDRVDRSDQTVAAFLLLAATLVALAAIVVDVVRALRGQSLWLADWAATALLLILTPWLLWTSWRLATGRLDTGPLLPAGGLILAGLTMEALALLFYIWTPEDRRAVKWLVVPGIGAVVLGLRRLRRDPGNPRSGPDVA